MNTKTDKDLLDYSDVIQSNPKVATLLANGVLAEREYRLYISSLELERQSVDLKDCFVYSCEYSIVTVDDNNDVKHIDGGISFGSPVSCALAAIDRFNDTIKFADKAKNNNQ